MTMSVMSKPNCSAALAANLPPELTRTAGWMIENHGCQQFFIEYRNRDTYKGCGIKVLLPQEVEKDRIIGAYGAREETFTWPILLQRGHKLVEVKASEKKPLHCTTYLYPMS